MCGVHFKALSNAAEGLQLVQSCCCDTRILQVQSTRADLSVSRCQSIAERKHSSVCLTALTKPDMPTCARCVAHWKNPVVTRCPFLLFLLPPAPPASPAAPAAASAPSALVLTGRPPLHAPRPGAAAPLAATASGTAALPSLRGCGTPRRWELGAPHLPSAAGGDVPSAGPPATPPPTTGSLGAASPRRVRVAYEVLPAGGLPATAPRAGRPPAASIDACTARLSDRSSSVHPACTHRM